MQLRQAFRPASRNAAHRRFPGFFPGGSMFLKRAVRQRRQCQVGSYRSSKTRAVSKRHSPGRYKMMSRFQPESHMKLLGVDASPYVRKVRIVLEEKHIPYEYVQARPSLPDSPVPQFNPPAKIPVLVTDKGKGIYDSPVIVEYLEMLVAEPRLIPAEPDARIDVKRWEALGDGIADATVAISHERRKPQE